MRLIKKEKTPTVEHQEILVHNGNFEPNSFQILKSYEEYQCINHTDLNLKSRGPILRVTSSETHSVCVKQALNTRR